MSINNFIHSLMRCAGCVMFVGGAGLFGYALVGGYYHYLSLLPVLGWGFLGWVLFFTGINLLEQYKAPDQMAAPSQPPMPEPLPVSPYAGAGSNTRNPWPSNPGMRQPITHSLDDQTDRM